MDRSTGGAPNWEWSVEPDDRQRAILARARADGHVAVGDLSSEFGVSPETVRRDLFLLAERGVLRRTHGGAEVVETTGFEATLAQRSTALVAERRRIGTAAAARLGGAESVYVDEGLTPQFVAEALPRTVGRPSRLTVVTPSLLTAGTLANTEDITVIVLGGRLRGTTMGTVDHWALEMLDSLVIDLAYVGANGISREHGLTTPDPAVAALKSRALSRARRRIFVGLGTRFGMSTFCRFAEVGDFEALVTDRTLSTKDAERYGALGPLVVRT